MKATRAYIASLGTTGVLLAASILLLTIVSTLVAFDGWPSGTVTARVDRLTLNDRVPAIPVSATATAAPPAAAAGGVALGSGTVRAPGGGSRGVAGERVTGLAPTPQGGLRVGLPGPGLPKPLGPGTPEIPTLPVPGTSSLKEQVAAGTEQTTRSAGASVGAVSAPAGDAVTSGGKTAADVIRALPVAG
jgi:hypothetical protein